MEVGLKNIADALGKSNKLPKRVPIPFLGEDSLQITLKTYSDLRKAIGRSEMVVDIDENSNLNDLISWLTKRYSDKFQRETGNKLEEKINRNLNIYIKGRLIYPSKYSTTKLQDEDEVTIMRPVGGG